MKSTPVPEPSGLSRAALLIMKAGRLKKRDQLSAAQRSRKKGSNPRRSFARSHSLSCTKVEGRTVWRLIPKRRAWTRAEKTPRTILYLHGGAYVLGFHWRHWSFIARLADLLDSEMIVPDYPLAPDHHALEVNTMLLKVYQDLPARSENERIMILGDSAGGGLALSLSQELKNLGLPQPDHLVLFSPWLDVTLSNPEIRHLDRVDPLLNIRHLRKAGAAYAGNLDPKDPRVSPIYGSFEGIAPVTVYVGTADLLLADCRLLGERISACGGTVQLNIIPGLTHPGVFLPIPEARWIIEHIRNEIFSAVRST